MQHNHLLLNLLDCPIIEQRIESKQLNMSKTDPLLPTMIVFDLDDCVWSPEMHELYDKPTRPIRGVLNPHMPVSQQVQGVIGLANQHGDTVKLYEGARRTLYELATNPIYQGIIIAVASTSLEPSCSHACLEGLEILPGRSLRDLVQ